MKIKRCPFCGGKEEVRVTNHGGWGVNCICGGMFLNNSSSSEEAIKKWNNRDEKAIKKLAAFLNENYSFCAPGSTYKNCEYNTNNESCEQCWIDWAYKDE